MYKYPHSLSLNIYLHSNTCLDKNVFAYYITLNNSGMYNYARCANELQTKLRSHHYWKFSS